MGIEAAGLGNYPQPDAVRPSLDRRRVLSAQLGPGQREGGAKGGDAGDGDGAGAQIGDALDKARSPGAELLAAQLVGAGGGAAHEVGDADAALDQMRIVLRAESQ